MRNGTIPRGTVILLAALWVLLVAVYSARLWLPRLVNVDFVFMVDPSAPEWLLPTVVVAAWTLPPTLLAAFTWWLVGRRKPALHARAGDESSTP